MIVGDQGQPRAQEEESHASVRCTRAIDIKAGNKGRRSASPKFDTRLQRVQGRQKTVIIGILCRRKDNEDSHQKGQRCLEARALSTVQRVSRAPSAPSYVLSVIKASSLFVLRRVWRKIIVEC